MLRWRCFRDTWFYYSLTLNVLYRMKPHEPLSPEPHHTARLDTCCVQPSLRKFKAANVGEITRDLFLKRYAVVCIVHFRCPISFLGWTLDKNTWMFLTIVFAIMAANTWWTTMCLAIWEMDWGKLEPLMFKGNNSETICRHLQLRSFDTGYGCW